MMRLNGNLRISLDIEGTLADIHEITLSSINKKEDLSIQKKEIIEWNFDGLPISIDTFLDYAKECWREEWRKIRPCESSITRKALNIYDIDQATTDIVTSRNNCYDEMRSWLHKHSILYNRFKIESDKSVLGYDLYIDDNPNLAGDSNLILMDRPWNSEVDASDIIERIQTLEEVPRIVKEVRKDGRLEADLRKHS